MHGQQNVKKKLKLWNVKSSEYPLNLCINIVSITS
jgi:hypothetical protein